MVGGLSRNGYGPVLVQCVEMLGGMGRAGKGGVEKFVTPCVLRPISRGRLGGSGFGGG